MLSALLNPSGLGSSLGAPSTAAWAFLALLIASGLMALLALSRAGIRHFWSAHGRGVPRLHVFEGAPVAGLLLACLLITVYAGPVMRYTQATAYALHDPREYINAVMSARPVPYPTQEQAVLPTPPGGTTP